MSANAGNQAAVLLAAVNQLAQQGRYDEAVAIVTQLGEAARAATGEQSLPYASMVQKIADLNRLKGDLPAAEAAYRHAAEILRATAGPDHPLLGETLNGLGLVLRSAGRTAEARQHLAEGTAIFKKAFGERSAYYVFALNNMAETDAMLGHYEEAIATYEQLLGIQRELGGGSTDSYGRRITQLGALYYEAGRYQDAIRTFEAVVDLARQMYGEAHLNYASSLSNLALQYKMLGEWGRTEKLYRQAIDAARAAAGEDDLHYAVYLSNLGNLYRERGQLREAAPLLRQCAVIYEKRKGKNDPDYATALNNLAVLLLAMDQTAQAEAYFREALEIDRRAYGAGHPKLIQDLLNLVTVLLPERRYQEAAPYLKEAREIAAKLGPRHPVSARILDLWREAALRDGNFKDAEAYAVMANEIWRTATGTDDPNYGNSLVQMGWVARARGRYQDAENVTRRALDVYRRTAAGGERVADAWRILAGVYRATGRSADALSAVQELEAADDRMIGQVFSVGTEDQRTSTAAALLSDLYLFASFALDDPATIPFVCDLVLRRKGVGAEALAVQRDAILTGRYAALEPQLRELRGLRMQISQKTLAGPGPEGPDAHATRLAGLTARKEKLEEELAAQIPEMNLEHLSAAGRQAIAQALPDGAALVEFVRANVLDFSAVPERKEQYWKPARYLAFVVPAGQPDGVTLVDLGEADPIDGRIASFRQAISGEPEDGADRSMRPAGGDAMGASLRSEPPVLRAAVGTAARRLRPDAPPAVASNPLPPGVTLREAVFDPLLPVLAGRTRLFVAPDGDLNRLPFEALPLDDERFVIDAYQISYLGVGRDVLRFGATGVGQPAGPLVAADPDYDLAGQDGPEFRRGEPFSRLPGTRQEGVAVSELLNVAPMLAEGALKQAVTACRSPRIMHIATHGFFLPDPKRDPNAEGFSAAGASGGGGLGRLSGAQNPLLRSGLALAGANTWLQEGAVLAEADDGILSAADVSGLDLLDTELVVLSACETGLGAVQLGEGVFGLRRAFVLAGARTLVMSLWQVPDVQTQEMMEDFYRRVLAGEPRADALRAAQLAIKATHPDLFYWGAFICQGDPGPLQRCGDGEPSR